MRDVAAQANRLGRFDAVIHNVGLGFHEPDRVVTADGLSQLWAVNVLAPYVLTALMHRPARQVYLSSGMHRGGSADLSDAQWARRRWNGVGPEKAVSGHQPDSNRPRPPSRSIE
jgi:NAD(P)-dependent dehydrogenase (short-subunit alcohol dehydrogenase family)